MIDRLDGSRPPRFREQELWGWGMRPRARCLLCRPPDRAGLKALLGAGGGTSLLGRGAGRSYGDASLNEGGGVADMRGLDRFLLFDRERGVLRAEAGVTIGEALEVTVPQGWFLPVVPGTRHVTLAGAVASDIHGKNHHRAGSIGRHLRALRILLASGEEVECSAEREPELLAATTGGMGLTGLILEVELGLLEVESSWMTVREAAATDLDHALELLEEGDARHSYSVAWIDGFPRGKGLGRGIVSFGDHAPRGALAGGGAGERGRGAG
ncbi:MAG: FAD-dependent oxidoreductase, partial [Planctomycetota bacterium]